MNRVCQCFHCIKKRSDKLMEKETEIPDEEVDFFQMIRDHENILNSFSIQLVHYSDKLKETEKRLKFLEDEYLKSVANGRCCK